MDLKVDDVYGDQEVYLDIDYARADQLGLNVNLIGQNIRAAIAGNIATASPIGDTLPLLLSLDAKIILDGIKKRELIPLNEFFISYRKTRLKKGQFIYSIKIPIYKKNIFKAFKKSSYFYST